MRTNLSSPAVGDAGGLLAQPLVLRAPRPPVRRRAPGGTRRGGRADHARRRGAAAAEGTHDRARAMAARGHRLQRHRRDDRATASHVRWRWPALRPASWLRRRRPGGGGNGRALPRRPSLPPRPCDGRCDGCDRLRQVRRVRRVRTRCDSVRQVRRGATGAPGATWLPRKAAARRCDGSQQRRRLSRRCIDRGRRDGEVGGGHGDGQPRQTPAGAGRGGAASRRRRRRQPRTAAQDRAEAALVPAPAPAAATAQPCVGCRRLRRSRRRLYVLRGPAGQDDAVYTPTDSAVIPPVLVRPVLPKEPPPGVPADQIGTIDVLVDEQGDVESVRLISPANRYHERMLCRRRRCGSSVRRSRTAIRSATARGCD